MAVARVGAVLPDGFAWDDSIQIGEETARLTGLVWPRFLAEGSDLSDAALSFELDARELIRRFPNWGIRRESDRKLVAHLGAATVEVGPEQSRLPDEGWQFAVTSGASATAKPNCLSLLVANVDPSCGAQGLATALLERGKAAARERGFSHLIAPVRPSRKSEYPLMPMEEYLAKHMATGEIFDPWLRAHLRAGGEIAGICAFSNCVRASVARWREWTGLALTESGSFIVPGGLVPLAIDLALDVGIYREPGVWVRYSV